MNLDLQLEKCRNQCLLLREKIQIISEDPRVLAKVSEENNVRLEEPRLRLIRTLQGHYGKVFDLGWFCLPDNTDLASVSQDGKILVWDVMTGNKKLALPLATTWILTVAVSPSGRLIASGGLDDTCTIHQIDNSHGWEVSQAHCELQQHEGYISKCRFVNENQIITSSGDSTCALWDIVNHTVINTFIDHTGDVMSISILQENGIFVSGSVDASVKIWDPRTGNQCIADFRDIHKSDINDVQWFPNNFSFATGSDDSSCKMFDHRAGRQLNQYSASSIYCGVTSLDFTKSGNYLISAYDDSPFLVTWGTLTAQFVKELPHEQRVAAVQCSFPGNALATASWDNHIRIWA